MFMKTKSTTEVLEIDFFFTILTSSDISSSCFLYNMAPRYYTQTLFSIPKLLLNTLLNILGYQELVKKRNMWYKLWYKIVIMINCCQAEIISFVAQDYGCF